MSQAWQKAQPWVSTAARIGLGLILIVAGGLKLPDPEGAIRAVRAYQLLPESLVPMVGLALPAFEVALGILLVLGVFTRISALLGVALMVVFIGGIISAWARGLSIDCGCFGGGGAVEPGQEKYLSEILRDLGFIALGLIAAVWPRSPLSVDAWLSGSDSGDSGEPDEGTGPGHDTGAGETAMEGKGEAGELDPPARVGAMP